MCVCNIYIYIYIYIYIHIYIYIYIERERDYKCCKHNAWLIGAGSGRVNNSPASLTLGVCHDPTPGALNRLGFIYLFSDASPVRSSYHYL